MKIAYALRFANLAEFRAGLAAAVQVTTRRAATMRQEAVITPSRLSVKATAPGFCWMQALR
ncbi:hypothetical protein D0B32_06575 [Paraburkholderia sp. DHOC27]|nr:hypothetical protein D0B32_06575 [Paraburkholderia sp. DHOC27]